MKIKLHQVLSRRISTNRNAADAQNENHYDADKIYETIVDPNMRSKQELHEFVAAAMDFYNRNNNDLKELFLKEFYFWNEIHFKIINRAQLEKFRDLRITNNVLIRIRAGLKVFKEISNYLNFERFISFTQSNAREPPDIPVPTHIPKESTMNTNALPTMMILMKAVFLIGQAKIHFAGNVMKHVDNCEEAINKLEAHFFDA